MPYFPAQKGDPYFIPKKDASRHYRYVSADPRRLGGWLMSFGDIPGYTLIQGATVAETIAKAKALGLPESYVNKVDNRIQIGLNILADIPIAEHFRRVKEKIDERIESLQAAKDSFHETADRLKGVHSREFADGQAEDEKEFHTREDRPFSGQAGIGRSPVLERLRRNRS